jgi:hypothetical protein
MNSLIYALLMAFSTLILESCTKTSAKAGAQESVEWAGHRFQEVATLRALPSHLQAVLGVGRSGLDGIADRGEKYNATDVVDAKLPMRRFPIAGLGNGEALVAIEHGGRGWRLDVALFSSDSS